MKPIHARIQSFFTKRIVLIIGLSGAALTIALFLHLRSTAYATLHSLFLQRSMSQANSVAQELDQQIDHLDGLRRFMDSQETIDRKAFSLYVEPLFVGAPVRALEWIPRVRQEDRIFYESSARQDGLERFRIYEKNAHGNIIPVSPQRSDYFPVYYLEPLNGNEVALGFDLASEPIRRAAIS